jgi:hypothetical protein
MRRIVMTPPELLASAIFPVRLDPAQSLPLLRLQLGSSVWEYLSIHGYYSMFQCAPSATAGPTGKPESAIFARPATPGSCASRATAPKEPQLREQVEA